MISPFITRGKRVASIRRVCVCVYTASRDFQKGPASSLSEESVPGPTPIAKRVTERSDDETEGNRGSP